MAVARSKRREQLNMQKKLFPSVKISYFNKEEVEKALREYIKELKEKRPEVEKVIVFGSFIRGESVPGSDVDLLIILKESKDSILDRIPRYLPSNFPVGVDVFPYTQEEIEKMKAEGNSFIEEALKEGKEV